MPLKLTICFSACCWLWLGFNPSVSAQEIEPRTYSNAPIGINFIGLGITQAQTSNYTLNSQALSYNHIFDFFGQSAKFNVVTPYAEVHGTAKSGNQVVNVAAQGFTDPVIRVATNLYGAPALTAEEFKTYVQDLIIGANLAVLIPWGEYHSNQVLNVGANRSFIQPGLGASQAVGPWRFELASDATFFSSNNNYMGGNTLSQKPIYSTTGHVIYYFPSSAWISTDVTYYSGGQSAVNGTMRNHSQENWLMGATLSIPINKRNAIKFHGSEGTYSNPHKNYTLYGIGWQYRWGPGT